MINEPHSPSMLHVSQKCFWFAASISLLVGTLVFSWRVYRGQNASVELLGMKFTSEAAEKSVVATRDRLLAIRTRLSGVTDADASAAVQAAVPELDEILKTLGVAEAALKKQQASPLFGDYGWNDYGSTDSYSYSPIPSPTATLKRH
jgi:hypothetical protein